MSLTRQRLRELIGIDLSKQQQLTDWGADQLTDAQIKAAAAYVHSLGQPKK